MRRNPSSALLAACLVALAAAAGWIVWKSELIRHPVTTGIAVLPFENLSDEKEHAAFADGVQDDILTKLAKIADLKVISRTSVMEYRGKRDLRQIGAALRVSHALEGTVRRSSGKVRVNAQLIDTRTDTHVWAEEYERDVNDVFAIQSEIAQKVAEQLHAKISAAEKLDIERRPTADLTAFDLYTRAKNLLLSTGPRPSRANLLQAVDLLNQAVARDPSFLQAYCQLAFAHDNLYWFGFDRTAARLALAEAAIQAASGLRPDAGETHLARAENLYRGYLDYDGALAELEVPRQTLPNDPRVFRLTGFIQRRQGRWEESTRNLERAVDLDPRNLTGVQELAFSYQILGRYAQADSRWIARWPSNRTMSTTKVALASVQFQWKADTRPLLQLIDSIRATNPAATSGVADSWLVCALAERDAAAAKNALSAIGENDFSLPTDQVLSNRPFFEGLVARMMKDDDKARTAFTAARAEQEKTVQAQPNYSYAVCVLGLIDAGLGRNEEALREGWRAVKLAARRKRRDRWQRC